PIRKSDFNLKAFIEQSGHNLSLQTNIKVTKAHAMGPLYKTSKKLKMVIKRWYVLDRNKETFSSYRDETCRNVKDVIPFQRIENVYIDDVPTNCTKLLKWSFCIKTTTSAHLLIAASSYLRQIWIDILMTAITGYHDSS
ncbi:hypothetical protein HELRODRAFT_85126, partial [Helobdella robusta]|uniref:PH domain-containing protein n=1 Tax=Helobdella robusta TaxID=6412 RepID=T1G5T2_HELRO